MEKENREHKNSVFVDLFYEDETAQGNLLSLYNALHDTDLQDESQIRKVRVEDVLYKNFKNDISFEIGEQVIVFGEHQSTVNPNMPLRCLMYAGRAYEQLVEKEARYRTTLVKIPTPEFYTFYNGEKEYPLNQTLRLSDAYARSAGKNSMELNVYVININSEKSHILLEKCRVLGEYSIFIHEVRKYANEEEALKKAIDKCIQKGILSDYLKRKSSEVRNMLIAEYSYEEDIQVKQQEAMQIGMERGMKRGMARGMERGMARGMALSGQIFHLIKKSPELTDSQAAKELGCTPEDVANVRKMFEL